MGRVLTVKADGCAGVLFEGARAEGTAAVFVGGGGSSPEESVQAASFLVDAGYTTLVLGYCGWEGTPQKREGVPLEYAERAVAYLKETLGTRMIVFVGVSEGAVFALLCATVIHDIGAVCAVVPVDYVMAPPSSKETIGSVYTWRGRAIPFVCYPTSGQSTFGLLRRALSNRDYGIRRVIRSVSDQVRPGEDAYIPVERMRADLLLIAPSYDDIWESEVAVERIGERLRQRDYPYTVQTEIYPDASHLMGGSYDLSGVALRLLRHILHAEYYHPNECDEARQKCLKRIVAFIESEGPAVAQVKR